MENYLGDVLTELIERASRLRTEAGTDFEMGLLQGYYETISKLLNEAEAFQIADKLPKELREYNPEDLLVRN